MMDLRENQRGKPEDQRGKLEEQEFSYRVGKDGLLFLYCKEKLVKRLPGKEGTKLLAKLVAASSDWEKQLLLAKATGNFKRGNERLIKATGNFKRGNER